MCCRTLPNFHTTRKKLGTLLDDEMPLGIYKSIFDSCLTSFLPGSESSKHDNAATTTSSLTEDRYVTSRFLRLTIGGDRLIDIG